MCRCFRPDNERTEGEDEATAADEEQAPDSARPEAAPLLHS
jgi:hypothetical protein